MACLMLLMCATSWSAPSTTEPLMLELPPHLQKYLVLPSGEKVLYFRAIEWIEFSEYVYAYVQDLIEESVTVAVVPLLIEVAGLEAENAVLRRPQAGDFWVKVLIGIGGVAVGVIAGALVAR